MKLEEISQVKVTSVESEVNDLLAKGYRITKILSSKSVVGDREQVQPVFVLGMVKEGK